MKLNTVALIISSQGPLPLVLETLTDDEEILTLEKALVEDQKNPLEQVHLFRERLQKEEDQFGEYVEDLLAKPFLNPNIQKNALQWIQSKVKIEKYQKAEQEAAEIIAQYAMKVFLEDSTKRDFMIASTKTQVRIRIFVIE